MFRKKQRTFIFCDARYFIVWDRRYHFHLRRNSAIKLLQFGETVEKTSSHGFPQNKGRLTVDKRTFSHLVKKWVQAKK